MRTVNVNPASERQNPLYLGRQGENLVTEIVFDLTDLIEEYGAGVPVVLHRRPLDDLPYEAALTIEDETATWSVSVTDTAQPGEGYAELQWYADDAVALSQVYKTRILKSVESVTSVEAGELWVQKLTAIIAEEEESAAEIIASAAEITESVEAITALAESAETSLAEIQTAVEAAAASEAAAAESATAAASSASEASGYAETAQTAATAAAASAAEASGYADNASASAETASGYAEAASANASTASDYASAAAESAESAASAAAEAAQAVLTEAQETGVFDGQSAYDYAVTGGYTGTEDTFAELMAYVVSLLDGEEEEF